MSDEHEHFEHKWVGVVALIIAAIIFTLGMAGVIIGIV